MEKTITEGTFREEQTQAGITRHLTVNIWTALGVLCSAALAAAVSTAFIATRTLNSDHFLLQSTATAISEVKTNQSSYVNKDVYNANQTALNSTLTDIKDQLKAINLKIK